LSKKRKIFISCTEQSGDNIACQILKKIKNKNIIIDGIGGNKSKIYFRKKFFDIKDFKSIGLFEIIFSVHKYIKMIKFLTNKILANKYDLVITIDSPDFNYQLVKKIRKKKYKNKIIHIVAPSVWAWRAGRAKKFAKIYDEIFTLFKFENKYFNQYNLKTTFIGHPIFHTISINNNNIKNYIAFLPGSREKEVKELMIFYELAYKILLKNYPKIYKIFIPTLPHLKKLILQKTKKWKLQTIISVNEKNIECNFQKVFVSVTCSGTATLEIAKRNIPQLVIYKFNFLTSIFAKLIIKVKYANLINIFANKMIIPELINFNLTKSNFEYEFMKLISNNKYRHYQLINVKKYLKYFVNQKSPYIICASRIKKII